MATRLRAQPLLDSFLGMDLKLGKSRLPPSRSGRAEPQSGANFRLTPLNPFHTGATLISLFALLNKVAGAYGILAVLLSGGAALSQPLGQLTMYAYSIASLVGFIWGLQKISEVRRGSRLVWLAAERGRPLSARGQRILCCHSEPVLTRARHPNSQENGPKTLLYAHGFAADHLVGTIYTCFFAVVWYLFVPHDGRRVANSAAQKAMMGGSESGVEMDEAERTAAAMGVWTSERGFSGTVLLLGWLFKVRADLPP